MHELPLYKPLLQLGSQQTVY